MSAELPRAPLVAESGWFFRFFTRDTTRISLTAGAVRFGNRSGDSVTEMPVSSIEALSIRRFLFRTRLTVRTAEGKQCSIGGLDKRRAASVHDAILAEAARSVVSLREKLKQIDWQQRLVFAGDHYIRHSIATAFHNALSQAMQRYRRLNRLSRMQLEPGTWGTLKRLAPLESARGFEAARERTNERFVQNSIAAVRSAASTTLRDPLTDEQARAIATDEDTTLVLAGAGTGKTSVIVGKLAYLVCNQDVSPDEILVVAYNSRAAAEIRDRLPVELAGAAVSTFHAFGYRVITECGGAPTISELADDDYKLRKAIDAILDELLEDPQQSDTVIKFILYNRAPWRSAFDFNTQAEYEAYVHSVELRTLAGDKAKSFEELTIANYLTEHGVEFRYEASYRFPTATQQHRQYRPDFFLPAHNIYIEHFALDEQGQSPPGWLGYAEGVSWKRDTHNQNGTTLIETCSWQHELDTLLPTLRNRLEALGVRFEPIPRETLIQQLCGQKISWLSKLLVAFLNQVKTSNLSGEKLGERARMRGDRQRNERFLDVFEQVLVRYEQALEDEQALDFHDLINLAERYVREGVWKSPYRYVLVDEYQDISAGRMRLLKALRRRNVTYFLVGDDWQSIYRFAGSDIRLVQGCGDHLGHVQERTLSQTFRFADGILNPSSEFIQRNTEQTQRPLRSESDGKDSGITVVFNGRPEEGLALALQEIEREAAAKRQTVLVLGRFNFSQDKLKALQWSNSLQVAFSTVHRAKGKEADYVIILDLRDGWFGFPARIEDDPLLDLVLPPVSGDTYPFAEERRLFYVAITRARNGAWLISDKFNPSTFVMELTRESGGLRQLGDVLTLACPNCQSGRLVASQSDDNLRCSNHPSCNFLAPRCPTCKSGYAVIGQQPSKNITCTNPACNDLLTICPQCGMGILLEKNGPYSTFLGCSTWVWSEPQCKYRKIIDMNQSEYDIPF